MVDRNVHFSAYRVIGKPADTKPEVLFWWLMTQPPAGCLFDLSLLLLRKGGVGVASEVARQGERGRASELGGEEATPII